MLHWWRFVFRKRQTVGFTLIELLVSTLISSIVISGLMSIAILTDLQKYGILVLKS